MSDNKRRDELAKQWADNFYPDSKLFRSEDGNAYAGYQAGYDVGFADGRAESATTSERALPKCPDYVAHPQSVWFEEHWRPIFEATKAESAQKIEVWKRDFDALTTQAWSFRTRAEKAEAEVGRQKEFTEIAVLACGNIKQQADKLAEALEKLVRPEGKEPRNYTELVAAEALAEYRGQGSGK